MTGRERAIGAMNFERTDRLPIMANGVSAGFVQRLLGVSEDDYWANQQECHFETMRRLGQDFHIQFWFPPRDEKRNWSRSDVPDWTDEDAVAADLEKRTAETWAELATPEGDREMRVREIMDYQTSVQERLGEEILWIFGMDSRGPATPGLPYGRYGYEGFFLALATYPEVVAGFIEAQAELCRLHNECVAEAADRLGSPKIGYTGHDMTTQQANMVHPRVMDRVYFPYLDRALEPLVKAGFKIIWHSDGHMNDMIPPLIGVGVAGFQGFQEECGTRISEVAKLRNRNGDPLVLWGSCSVTRVIRDGTFEDIAEEVQRVLDEWPHPGLCLATPTYLGEDVPDRNTSEFYRLCRDMGRGGRSR